MSTNRDRRAVVVGVDGSAATGIALDWAMERARATGAPLRLVAAYPADAFLAPVGGRVVGPDRRTHAALETVARHHLKEAERRVHELAPGLEVESAALGGPTRAVLLHEAQRAEVVVVGSRRLGPVHRVFSPSTGAASAARASCPVVVVREAASRSLRDTRVVVAVDGAGSAAAVRFGFADASRYGAGLTVAHAWRLPTTDLGALVRAEQTSALVASSARARLADLLAPLTAEYPDVDVRTHVVEAYAVDELTRLSENARLLVVGSRGLGALWSLLLGSVSREVIRRAHCPVAVVHPQSGVPEGPGTHRVRAEHLPG